MSTGGGSEAAPSPQSADYVTNGAQVLKRKSTAHSGVDEVSGQKLGAVASVQISLCDYAAEVEFSHLAV